MRRMFPCALFVLLSACSADAVQRGEDPLVRATSVSSLPSPVGAVGCEPASSWEITPNGRTEVQADSTGSMWALFATEAPIPAGTELDVAWRLEGAHSVRVVMVSSRGEEIPAPGPVPVPGVRWDRPGDAFRSTIEFPEAGCWRVVVSRGGQHGDLWVEVGDGSA